MRKIIPAVVLALLLGAGTSEAAKNFQLRGKNELCGGIGFAAGLSNWSPGGFKWFNDYSREMSKLVWFNLQLNVTAGNSGNWGCETCYDNRGRPYTCHCGGYRNFGGTALEFAAGVKLKWRLRQIPLQFHAKIGGIFSGLFWGNDTNGLAFGVRGGFGVRYFFVPTFGVGAELMLPTIGPAWVNNVGWNVYATIDFNAGIEWRF